MIIFQSLLNACEVIVIFEADRAVGKNQTIITKFKEVKLVQIRDTLTL